MMNMSDLDGLLGPYYKQTVGANLQFLRDFKATNGNPQLGYSNSGYQTQQLPPGVMSAQQVQFMDGMKMQMQMMQQMMMQMGMMLISLQGKAKTNPQESGITDAQWKQIQDFIKTLTGTTPATGTEPAEPEPTGYDKALEALQGMTTDGATVDDVSAITDALEGGDYTREELLEALQSYMVDSEDASGDELLQVIALLEADGAASLKEVLTPEVIDELSDAKMNAVADGFAAKGFYNEDGLLNYKLLSSLMDNLDGDAPENQTKLAQKIIKSMTEKYILVDDPEQSANADALYLLLTLLGFQYNEDGSLMADENQPFGVGISS